MRHFLHDKRTAYITFILILGFELAVLVLVFFPDVSDRYKAYFIDKTVSCWTKYLLEPVSLDQIIYFTKQEIKNTCQHVGRGWRYPKPNGLWSQSEIAEILIQPKWPVSSPIFLELGIWARAPKADVRKIDILINNIKVSTVSLIHRQRKLFTLRVPDELLEEGIVLKVSFIKDPDQRAKGASLLGMGIQSIKITDKQHIDY